VQNLLKGKIMIEIEYTNKPSAPTLRAAIRKAVAAGKTWMQLSWGENRIDIERGAWGWSGRGWIGRNSGQDLANELNQQERK
jgi:hypothetical protein